MNIIDLSEHNGSVDFNEIKKHCYGVIIRVGYGSLPQQKDIKFEEYYKKACEANLLVGAYLYSYALTVNQAKEEAKQTLKWLKNKKFDLPIFYDMEDADHYKMNHGMPTNNELSEMCNTFVDIISKKYKSGVYASSYWFDNILTKVDVENKWVANWNINDGKYHPIKGVYYMHQFTSEYKIGKKRFDMSILNPIVNIPETSLKSVTEIAKEVINNKWGVGADRKKRLEKAGYDYETIQNKVNELVGVKKVKQLILPRNAKSWNVYPINKAPVVGNECGKLNPYLYNGLIYDIIKMPYPNVAQIKTKNFGVVNIYVGKETGAIIK